MDIPSQNARYVPVFKEHDAGPSARSKDVCAVIPRPTAGGASRDRTDDPLLAKQVLSQLSYGPDKYPRRLTPGTEVVGLGGLEPPASPLSGVRSNHLSYRPKSRACPGRQHGGACRDRTDDPLLAKQVLSQLS